MTRETLWNSLDRLTPDEETVGRIWDTILHAGAPVPQKAKKAVPKRIPRRRFVLHPGGRGSLPGKRRRPAAHSIL